jgi:hypothetical protein
VVNRGYRPKVKGGETMISDTEKVKLLLPVGAFPLGVIRAIQEEYLIASKKFKPFHSAHEGFAIIEEEYDELKAEVFRKHKTWPKMRREAVQLATMALRLITDICDNESKRG